MTYLISPCKIETVKRLFYFELKFSAVVSIADDHPIDQGSKNG